MQVWLCMYVRICVCIFLYLCACMCNHGYVYACVHARVGMRACVWACACICTCVNGCAHAYVPWGLLPAAGRDRALKAGARLTYGGVALRRRRRVPAPLPGTRAPPPEALASQLLGVSARPPPRTKVPPSRAWRSEELASCSHTPCPSSPGQRTTARKVGGGLHLRRKAGRPPTGAVLPAATSGLGRPAKPRCSLDPAGRALPRPPPTVHRGGLLSACHRPRGTARHGPRQDFPGLLCRPVCHLADCRKALGPLSPLHPSSPRVTLSPVMGAVNAWLLQAVSPWGREADSVVLYYAAVRTPRPAPSRSCNLLSESVLRISSVTPLSCVWPLPWCVCVRVCIITPVVSVSVCGHSRGECVCARACAPPPPCACVGTPTVRMS